jgi:PHD/YefM family antitoxin component YafN of YafNO toxin-antitoxin module
MATWTFQQAEEHFEEMFEAALTNGPQTITKDGEAIAVMLSEADYLSLPTPRTHAGA